MSTYTVEVDTSWPYFVKLTNRNDQSWYTAQFSGGGYPDKEQLEAVSDCLKRNLIKFNGKTLDLANMDDDQPRPTQDELFQVGTDTKSILAIFVEGTLEGRQIMLYPTNMDTTNLFWKTRTVSAKESWPVGTKRVRFLRVPLAPIRKVGIGRPAAGSTLPAIPGAQPAATRQPVADSRQGGNGRTLYAGGAPAAGGLAAQPPARRPAPRRYAYITTFDNVEGNKSVSINLIEGDIVTLAVTEKVEAVVNAANSESFATGDGGISGALRDAMYPKDVYDACIEFENNRRKMSAVDKKTTETSINDAKRVAEFQGEYNVCGARKLLQGGSPVTSIQESGAASQDTRGYLKDSRVQYVLHAVGPKWNDDTFFDGSGYKKNTFDSCCIRLDDTLQHVLELAASLNVKSIAIPVISGGMFCHSDPTLKGQEQIRARDILLQSIRAYVAFLPTSSSLEVIYIVEIDPIIVKDLSNRLQHIEAKNNAQNIIKMRRLVNSPARGGR